MMLQKRYKKKKSRHMSQSEYDEAHNYNIETNPRTNKISGVLPYFQNIKPKQ